MYLITNDIYIEELKNIAMIINFIINYLTFAILEYNFNKIILENLYYYTIFCFLYGFISFGLIQEICNCFLYNRYPSIYNINQIFIKIFDLFSYKSPNRILL